MRFFKAFNILHRRTKSATFVPGPEPELSFVDASYSRGHVSSQPINASPSLLFELATMKEPTVPPNFNHLADRVSGLWRPKRSSHRSSTASAFDAMEKEHARLKDIIQFWVLEHSKLQANLAQCRDDLLAEQRKATALEQKTESDSLLIEGLTGKISHYERLFAHEKVESVDSSLISSHSDKEHAQLPALQHGMVRASIDRDPNVPSGPSSKLRTVDEYSSALRMTLTSRKQLREQKKITKFWKTEALAKSHDESLITPSVSAISSIEEQPLSSRRQDALKALIIRRGQTLSLLPNLVSSSTIGTMKSTLPSSASNASGTSSRLSPLASESMKAEVNLMFGSKGSLNRLALTPPKKLVGHLHPLSSDADTTQASASTSTASSIPIRKSLNIESFSDLNGFFNVSKIPGRTIMFLLTSYSEDFRIYKSGKDVCRPRSVGGVHRTPRL